MCKSIVQLCCVVFRNTCHKVGSNCGLVHKNSSSFPALLLFFFYFFQSLVFFSLFLFLHPSPLTNILFSPYCRVFKYFGVGQCVRESMRCEKCMYGAQVLSLRF